MTRSLRLGRPAPLRRLDGPRRLARQAWARPRRLALGAYLAFAVAFLSLFPSLLPLAIGAAAINGPIVLGGGWLLAGLERLARPGAAFRVADRTLQYASTVWLYSALAFALAAVAG